MGNKPIQELHINYFKFFTDNEPIKINGNHVLLYGENGSGKSSIYWALYTLLEAVYKSDAEQNKYFESGNNNSLLNLNTPSQTDSFVEIALTGGKTYRIGYNDFDIKKNFKDSADATARGSDFMNYRFMFKISDFRHRDEIDLFSLFEKEVFPYLKTRNSFSLIHQSKTTNDFNEIWEDLGQGVQQLNREESSQEQLNSVQKIYADKLRAFVEEINDLGTDINTLGNTILNEDLEYNKIRFEVQCIQKFEKYTSGPLKGKDTDINIEFPKILLTIPDYDGHKIARPQSFLNEAKWTAIGIAIRFAIVGIRKNYVDNADFQLLVLDDLLVSLDMSNRKKVLALLLNKYADDYQIFILTHDRGFYNFADKKIKEYGKDKEWEVIEMYEDDLSVPSKPCIHPVKDKLTKAEEYLKLHDYPACGLYLRTECESILDTILPDKFRFNVTLNDGKTPKNLNDKIHSLKEFFVHEGIDYTPFKELKIYKDVILNTLAHNDIESPLYKEELKIILNIVKELSKIRRSKEVVKSGKDLLVEIEIPSTGILLQLSIKTREPFVLVEEEGKPVRLSNFGKCELLKYDNGIGWIDERQGYDDIKGLLDKYKTEYHIEKEYDLLDLIKYRSKTLRELLNDI